MRGRLRAIADRIVHSHLITALLVTLGLFVMAAPPVAAQMEAVGDAMCGYGLGEIITFLFALIALLLIIKAAFMVMLAFDNFNSPKQQDHEVGKDQMRSATWTFVGAFVPLIFAAFLDVIGVNTVSCLEFDIGILVILV